MFLNLLVYTGYPLATVLSFFMEMGDGSGNETGMIEFMTWAYRFGIVIWIGVVVIVSLLIKHFL